MLHYNKTTKGKESGRFYFTVLLAHRKMLVIVKRVIVQTNDCTHADIMEVPFDIQLAISVSLNRIVDHIVLRAFTNRVVLIPGITM